LNDKVNSFDFYEALAWRGLKEHDVKAWTDLSPERKKELRIPLKMKKIMEIKLVNNEKLRTNIYLFIII